MAVLRRRDSDWEQEDDFTDALETVLEMYHMLLTGGVWGKCYPEARDWEGIKEEQGRPGSGGAQL